MDLALLLSMPPAPRRSHPTRSEGQLEHLRAMHAENRRQADERYRQAMEGNGWMDTYRVECALGLGRFCAKDKLLRLRTEGLVARRNRDGEKKYNRKRGYEWKWLGPHNLEGVK